MSNLKSISQVAVLLGIPAYKINNLVSLQKLKKKDSKFVAGRRVFTPKNVETIKKLLEKGRNE